MATARTFSYRAGSGENIYGGITPKIAHVYIGSGQSNYRGRGALADSPIAQGVNIGNVKTWRRESIGSGDGQWLPLSYETNQYGGAGLFGSILKFAMQVSASIEDSNNDIYFISMDDSGVPIQGWVDGWQNSLMYNGHFIPAMAALSGDDSYDEIRIQQFMWDQGESDSADIDIANAYKPKLEAVIADVREFFGTPKLPVFIRRTESNHTYSSVVGNAQTEIANADDNITILNGPWVYSDGVHIDGTSQNTVADARYAASVAVHPRGFMYA